jgi:pSer/pThr/pTyr-binding forkhead associated (FHA) protein
MNYATCLPCGLRQSISKKSGKPACSRCGGELVPEQALSPEALSAASGAKVTIEVVEGSAKGQTITFERHDTLLVGRDPDCHIQLAGDPAISRHHCLLEVAPPRARLRDLGSRNGTFINDVRYGKREKGESPEEAAKRAFPEVDLHDSCKVRIGKTVVCVQVQEKSTPPSERKEATSRRIRISCLRCGRDLTNSGVFYPDSDPICGSCRTEAGSDPMKVLVEMVGRAEKAQASTSFSLPDYQVEKRIGQGAFGAVYLARRRKGGEQVAIKVMLPQVEVTDESRELFRREISVLRKLDHPNIISYLEHGSVGDAFYFVMDYCEAGSIHEAMKPAGGKLSFEPATAYTLEALEGMAFAHAKGYIHRDLKPQNILLTHSSGKTRARISDFGLAKCLENAGLSGMTLTGTAAGSPDYMPREQVTNFRDVKPSCDVFSMAATYYKMLTGLPPRGKTQGKDPIVAVLQQQVIPILKVDPGVPKPIAVILDKALQPKAKDRYPTAAEFRDALKKAL